MDVKEQAVALRKQGLTYVQISSSLDGALSVDWYHEAREDTDE